MTDPQALCAEVYPRLVGQVALLTAITTEAKEVVQDAVMRLLPRWDAVSAYSDSEAWLRRVAMRVAVSRWRRSRATAAGVLRLPPDLVSRAPGPVVPDLVLRLAGPVTPSVGVDGSWSGAFAESGRSAR